MKKFKLTYTGVLLAMVLLSACSDDNDTKIEKPIANQAPFATSAEVTTQTEVPIEDDLQGTDPDGDNLEFSLVSEPSLGVVIVNSDGSYIYTPNDETTGSDSFTFAVSDGVNAQATAEVNITIEVLEVDFATLSRDAFNQAATDEPLSVNGRTFTNSDTQDDFDDLLKDN